MSEPQGYVFKPIPHSVQESISSASNDRVKTITKASIQGYIKTFMDSMGSNRKLMEAITKQGLQYITDKSFSQDDDPTKRHTQLVRFFNEVKESLPAILIVDQGIKYVPQTLGQVDSARIINGKWQGQFPIIRQVPLKIIVATRDEESTDLLQSLMGLMFGELRNLAGGQRITGNVEQGDRWVVTLPLDFESDPVEMADITDDPKDKVWYSGVSITPVFEDRIIIEQPMERVEQGNFIVNSSPDMPPAIDFPDTVSINQKVRLFVSNLQKHYKIVLDNSNVALLDQNKLIITPRQLGKFKIKIIDPTKRADEPLIGPKLLVEKEVTVTF